jgi:hypothetical protein
VITRGHDDEVLLRGRHRVILPYVRASGIYTFELSSGPTLS